MHRAQVFLLIVISVLCGGLVGCAPRAQVTQEPLREVTPQIHWQLPDGWQVRYTGDGVRWATLQCAPEVEVIITRFPGSVGDELANINRWRAQLGLAPASEGKMETPEGAATPSLRSIWLTNETQVLAAAELPTAEATFVFKLTGPLESATAQRDNFINFQKSLQWK